MMRLLTTFAFVILGMAVPHGASAAGLESHTGSTRIMPRCETLSSALPAHAGTRADQAGDHAAQHSATVARPGVPVPNAQPEPDHLTDAAPGRAFFHSRLPDARAPPA